MQIIIHPQPEEWSGLLQRPYHDNSSLINTVQEVLQAVKKGGDGAVQQFNQQWGGYTGHLLLPEAEWQEGAKKIEAGLKEAIDKATANIRTFHQRQVAAIEKIETTAGIICWREWRPVEKVGLYIPGGSAPLFSTVLMLGIPAQIAGCKEIILCTPPQADGSLHPAILYAAKLCGVTKIVRAGGAQAIAALAYGTKTVPQVYKIFGPGNQYVTAAKQAVQLDGLAIDMPAGPSEVCVIADETADVRFVAADLLSQAEHGPDSQVLLITTSESCALQCKEEVYAQMKALPRKEAAAGAIGNSKILVTDSLSTAVAISNEYAPEHLILNCAGAETLLPQITNAGSVFIGAHTPESLGDYASGTNHTLPTNGFARAYSGVSVDSFMKKMTVQRASAEGLKNISSTVIAMAEAEGLQAHAEAVRIRIR